MNSIVTRAGAIVDPCRIAFAALILALGTLHAERDDPGDRPRRR